MSIPTEYEAPLHKSGGVMPGDKFNAGASERIKVKIMFCKTQVLDIHEFWNTILHPYVLGFVAVLGIFLAGLASGLVYYGGLRWIHVPLYALVIPSLAMILTAAIITLYQYLYSLVSSRGPTVYWLLAMLPALFLVDIIFGVVRVLAEGAPATPRGNLILPVLLWTVIAEGMTIFAVKFLVEPFQEKQRWIAGFYNGADTPALVHSDPVAPLQIDQRFVKIGEQSFDLNAPLILEAQGNYVMASSPENSVLVRGPLSSLLEDIDKSVGLRIHRSYWVSLAACAGLTRDGTDMYLETKLGQRMKIARPRQSDVSNTLAQNSIIKNRAMPRG